MLNIKSMILLKMSAILMSVGLLAFAIAALTLTASAQADDPLAPSPFIVAPCTGCPKGGPCGNPAPLCTNQNGTCQGGANLCTACTCQPTLTTGCVCQ